MDWNSSPTANSRVCGPAQGVDQGELDAVRVLELVHHQVLEALPPGLADRSGGPQQLERPQLEVLEVGARSAPP